MAATVKKLDELLATGDLPVLGWTLSWHLSGVEIQHADLVTLLKDNHLEAWIPGEPTQRQALRRAVEEWIRQRANRQGGPRLANEAALRDDGSGNAQRALVRCINRAGSQFLIYELVVENV